MRHLFVLGVARAGTVPIFVSAKMGLSPSNPRAARSISLALALVPLFFIAGPLASARADITSTGDVSPSEPSTWTGTTTAYIGDTSAGTVTVDADSDLTSYYGYVGYGSSATGVVNINGSGSTWTSSYQLHVGSYGSGTLSITDGGSVISSNSGFYRSAYIGRDSGSTGVVTVNGVGSIWNNSGSLSVGGSGSGTLSITNGGSVIISSSNSGFDPIAYIGRDSGSTGVVTVNGVGSIWNNSGDLSVGSSGSGTLSITDGGSVINSNSGPDPSAYIGRNSGSTGVVTVDGGGSIWNNSSSLSVGGSGSGTLSITNGASVTCHGGGINSGVVTVDGAGSTWTSNGAIGIGTQGSGTLSIANGGSVSYYGGGYINSGVVTVEGAGSTWSAGSLSVGGYGSGTLSITSGGSVIGSGTVGGHTGSAGVVTVNGIGSTWKNSGDISIGDEGSGTLSITNGGSVDSAGGFSPVCIGSFPGSTGMVIVDGTGSTWNDSEGINIGFQGRGTLSITDGGRVSSSGHDSSSIGFRPGSTGVVMLDGAGSIWTNSSGLYVGYVDIGGTHNGGSGTLSATGGGIVTAKSVVINNTSLMAIDVGRGSSLSVGSGAGTLTNGGTVRILAGAGVPVDDSIKYSPISAKTWSGTGTYQPVGGAWDATNHLFTASSVSPGASGSPVAIDRALVQRVLIGDDGEDGTGWTVGASFVAAMEPASMTFTATAVADAVLGGQEVLGAWTFATTDYDVSTSNPIYLSFDVGAKYPADELHVWHYDGSVWTPYSPFDLTYDGTYASFTVTGLSGYAVTPEPGTLALLAVAIMGSVAWARRKRR
jgi:T5SS/PEP-CTERM-associated repeat protein